MTAQPVKRDEKSESFWRKLILPEEDRYPPRQWCGSFRWFRSPNILKLEEYRTPAEMDRIRKVLLRPGRRYQY